MPFYYRNSISFGPFRVTLSKSGVGVSAGMKGFRFGTGPRGHFIHAGMNGIYYRQSLGGIGRKKAQSLEAETPEPTLPEARADLAPTYLTPDGVTIRRVLSSGVERMVDSSMKAAVDSLNEARARASFVMLSLLFGGLLLLLIVLSDARGELLFAVGAMIAVLTFFASRADLSRRNVVLAYELDEFSKSAYEATTKAFDHLGAARGLWYVDAAGDVTNLTAWKRNAGASQLVSKHPTAVKYEAPPGVQSNITPPSIAIDGKVLYFLPDCVLVREGRQYGAVAYPDLRLATRPSRFIVEDAVPSDCKVVGSTWKHPNKNGGPDRRFRDNRQLPICLFEELGMISVSGLKALIMASARSAVSETETALGALIKTSKEVKPVGQTLLFEDR
ncbi:DUF4236 domain-containing protein [Salipiger abyssi]|uniref:DUF4236 domain-containing protein n=1 Tax=Salipiger abyssi TaxID=1250539 RepID=UPI000978C3EA|nr:DUF4236 domain-containing protein [Salipiger abyssi]